MAEHHDTVSESDALSSFSDEELVRRYRLGRNSRSCETEIVVRYFSFIKSKASSFGYDCSSREDLVEEGLLGLMNAVRCFDEEKGNKFSAYAYSCVVNRMRTAAEKLSKVSESEETSEDEHGEDREDPESIFLGKELAAEIRERLTPSEFSVFSLYAKGMTAGEISAQLGISYKSADNAVQRSRRKLMELFSE